MTDPSHRLICKSRTDSVAQILIGGLHDWIDANGGNASAVPEPTIQLSTVDLIAAANGEAGGPVDTFGFATESAAASAKVSVQDLTFEQPAAPEVFVVTTEFTIDEDVDTFDEAAFRASALSLFPSASDLIVTVAAGSVVVTTQAVFEDSTNASAAAVQLQSASTTDLTASLGVEVTAASAPCLLYTSPSPRDS